MEDLVLHISRVFTLKEVLLVEHEVETATKGPDVDLVGEVGLLKDQFWGRVVDMPGEVLSSEQLFKVVWKTDGV